MNYHAHHHPFILSVIVIEAFGFIYVNLFYIPVAGEFENDVRLLRLGEREKDEPISLNFEPFLLVEK
jgi:hypothetical protein